MHALYIHFILIYYIDTPACLNLHNKPMKRTQVTRIADRYVILFDNGFESVVGAVFC